MAGEGENPSIRDVCDEVIVVAHREDTRELTAALRAEGFHVSEVLGPYKEDHAGFSAVMKCLVNHANAWRMVADRTKPCVIVEADFVPVRGMGKLPVPVPIDNISASLGYLYSVGPQFWDLARPDLARGHGGGTVALMVSPQVARLLLQFFDEAIETHPDGEYYPFDTEMGYWLMRRGIESYIPYRHYGEHGGFGNPEHAQAGLGRPHRADALDGKLAFYPTYADKNILRYCLARTRARLWGVLRLCFGRAVARHDIARTNPRGMLRFSIGRLLWKKRPRVF